MAEAPKQSQQNLMTLSMMKQLNSDGKYWDVQLQIDNKVFKCQRSVLAANSEYFDTMFSSSNFEESNKSKDQPIPLKEFDAAAFEELSQFMYTGDICVKDSNIFQFLFMNDFLRLRAKLVKERCLEHVKNRSQGHEPISNALDLLYFAFLKGENVLFDTLLAHICRHLYNYSKDARLMEISFEILNALLELSKDYILPLRGSADVLLMIVHNWINHDREGRSQHRSDLMKNIDFAKVSSNFARSLINRLEKAVDDAVNLSKDIESLSMLAIGRDTNLIDGYGQFDAIVSYKFENLYKLWDNKMFYTSPSLIISNLSWKIALQHKDDELRMYLCCDGTKMSSVWNCYASATLTIVCQKEGGVDFVRQMSRTLLFSSYMKWGPPTSMKWNELGDEEKGYITHNDSITVNFNVHADVPFLKMI